MTDAAIKTMYEVNLELLDNQSLTVPGSTLLCCENTQYNHSTCGGG